MSFNGSIIRTKVKEAGMTLIRLSEELAVTRQTVNSWIGGNIPRGNHLVKLCSVLKISPNEFFEDSMDSVLSVPLHRTVKGKQVSNKMRIASLELAEQYINLFRQAPTAAVVPVIRVKNKTQENAEIIAEKLRRLSGVSDDKPMDFNGAFKLLSEAGIYVILREFPSDLYRNSYAFYSKIADHRVVFVNIDTNILDLIFQLLHETVHAVQDEEPNACYVDEEEKFCDKVAELIQFPEYYMNMAIKAINDNIRYAPNTDKKIAILVKKLKELSKDNKHSLFGIYYRLRHMGVLKQKINVGGAATILKSDFPAVRDVLFPDPDPRSYVDMLFELSPNFMNLVASQIPGCSIRKFGEWIGLGTSIDAGAVIQEITRRKALKK